VFEAAAAAVDDQGAGYLVDLVIAFVPAAERVLGLDSAAAASHAEVCSSSFDQLPWIVGEEDW
jgi:hypothetical protein